MAKKIIEKPTLFCRDCAYHYGEHNEGAKGKILCKCEYDGIDHFLNYDYCEKIKLK